MTQEPPGATVLKEMAEFLEANGIDYWLGRGRFRHFTLHGAFGDAESDIDFHVLRSAAISLRAVLPELVRRGYTVTDSVSRHKLALTKGDTAVEFVYLDQTADDPDALYHETAYRRENASSVRPPSSRTGGLPCSARPSGFRKKSIFHVCSVRDGEKTRRAAAVSKSQHGPVGSGSPNQRSQATAGAHAGNNGRVGLAPAAPEAQRYTHREPEGL